MDPYDETTNSHEHIENIKEMIDYPQCLKSSQM